MSKKIELLAIDLEFDDDKNIIQIGAIYSGYNERVAFDRTVNSYTQLSDRIIELTGITQEKVNSADDLYMVCQELKDWYETLKPKPFINCLTWSGNDSITLANQSSGLLFFGNAVIDVKSIYSAYQLANNKYPVGSLHDACNALNIDFEGMPHKAIWDAYNTLRVFEALIGKKNINN